MGVIVEYHGDLFVSGGYDDRGWSISTWFKEKALRHDLTWIGGWAHYHRWAPVDEVTRIVVISSTSRTKRKMKFCSGSPSSIA